MDDFNEQFGKTRNMIFLIYGGVLLFLFALLWVIAKYLKVV